MDANGLRFWQVADVARPLRDRLRGGLPICPGDAAPDDERYSFVSQWHFDRDDELYDPARRCLRLPSRRSIPASDVSEQDAAARLARVPMTVDAFGAVAFWSEEAGAILASGAYPGAAPTTIVPLDRAPHDMCVGADAHLYVALETGVLAIDLHALPLTSEDVPRELSLDDFSPSRLAPHSQGGVWVLDRDRRRLAVVTGRDWPKRVRPLHHPTVFRPDPENPDAPNLVLVGTASQEHEGATTSVEALELPAGERYAAIAASPAGRLAVLSNRDADGAGLVRLLGDGPTWGEPTVLVDATRPYSLAWVDDERVAVMVVGLGEAPVYPVVARDSRSRPVGDLYPLGDHDGGPFLQGIALPPRYPAGSEPAGGPRACPLHHLSLPRHERAASAVNFDPARPDDDDASRGGAGRLIDSKDSGTVWHRLYVDAVIPENCQIRVHLAASDDLFASLESLDAEEDGGWFEHRFGRAAERDAHVPVGAWMREPSELPGYEGPLRCERRENEAGCFTVLIQRAAYSGSRDAATPGVGRRVRDLRGRYLWIRVELTGDGRTTPELYAVRAYGSRFSYLEHYLPELYHETLFGTEAHAESDRSTPPDFLGRFLGLFESVLTPLEDRVANMHVLSDPARTPAEAIPWLGSWIGFEPMDGLPEALERRRLQYSYELSKRHGTERGLRVALELALPGSITTGRVVILEDWRLRRTFATILGADLGREYDPLFAGEVESGNSFVGDTLFLGDENRREFLALFAPSAELEGQEEAFEALYDDLAHRVTLLVHGGMSEQERGWILRVVEREVPAHVRVRVIAASHRFLVGVSSLVGVDSFLAEETPPGTATLGRSRIGLGDRIHRPASLDPRLRGHEPTA